MKMINNNNNLKNEKSQYSLFRLLNGIVTITSSLFVWFCPIEWFIWENSFFSSLNPDEFIWNQNWKSYWWK